MAIRATIENLTFVFDGPAEAVAFAREYQTAQSPVGQAPDQLTQLPVPSAPAVPPLDVSPPTLPPPPEFPPPAVLASAVPDPEEASPKERASTPDPQLLKIADPVERMRRALRDDLHRELLNELLENGESGVSLREFVERHGRTAKATSGATQAIRSALVRCSFERDCFTEGFNGAKKVMILRLPAPLELEE
jgi:hypothetical protein